jgi:predicted dehydrogenase
MAEAARGRGQVAAVGLQARSSPVIQLVKRLLAGGFVGEVLSSSVIGSGMHWANRSDPSQLYMLDQANGASLLSIACGHMLDAFCDVLGEFSELVATTAICEPVVQLGNSGETATKTIADQVALSGTLASGAVAAFHYRARPSRGKNFYWEINGTKGDLVMEAATGQFQFADVRLRGARGREPLLEILPEPQDRWVPAEVPDGPALNVAQAYVRLAEDLRTGSRRFPDFDVAVMRHRMLGAIAAAADSGSRQTYTQAVGISR